MAHQSRGKPSHGANSLFAAACVMMEKEHGGACADLVESRDGVLFCGR